MTQPHSRFSQLLDVYNGYPLALIAALLLHFLVLAALVVSGFTDPPLNPEIVQPSIRAFTIDENPQLRNEREAKQRQAAADAAAAERRRQQERERQRAEDAAAAERQRQQELDQQRAEQAAAEERRRQAELDRQRQEQAAAEERRRQQELDRQRQEQAEAEQRRREAELAQQRAEQEAAREAAAAAAAEVARTEQQMVMAYTGVIHDLIRQNWSRPPSARNGMTAVFRIQMVPTGDILDVELVQSSGDFAFDRAAESAIYRVGRFQELQGMPINLFNENFRSLLLTFRPEDLLN
ncbi:MAG: cell envelope integrity protein TolA [Gammaproteobacteria bacterium]|nr:cell envelope integrity protein TolA [Pseudomonadales bacterium]MCP5345972.1 cell envelope integrity protein TolA [Pseudomonadales bacterium]